MESHYTRALQKLGRSLTYGPIILMTRNPLQDVDTLHIQLGVPFIPNYCRSMINKPWIPNITPIKGRGFMNHGSGLA